MIKRKNIELAIVFGLLFSVALSFAGFDAECDGLRNNILRLHIIANSDSNEDQALKLKVRDAVLSGTDSDFKNCDGLESAVTVAKKDIDKITALANTVIKENGFSYGCKTSVGKEYFGTREYDNFTLPAGEYNSLVLRLGKAEGHNWWCVVFPGVCVPSANDGQSLKKSVSNGSCEVAYGAEKYVIRFKAVELYEKIKENLKKN